MNFENNLDYFLSLFRLSLYFLSLENFILSLYGKCFTKKKPPVRSKTLENKCNAKTLKEQGNALPKNFLNNELLSDLKFI